MKIKNSLVLRVAVALGLGAVSNLVQAAPQLSFTDSWHDSGAGNAENGYFVNTTGSASVTISLPLNGVDLGEADAGSSLALNIGPVGATVQVFSGSLGDATSYTPGKNTATFQGTDESITFTWTSTTITVSGRASLDILGEEQLFAMSSMDTPTNIPIDGFYEVSLTMDTSDNGGGIFNYDNQYVPVKGSDKETEFNPPDESGPDPLESGSITGTGDFTPPKLAITSPAAGAKVYDANTVLDLKGTASDGEGLTNVECIVNGDTDNPIQIDQVDSLPTNKLSWTAEVDLSVHGQVGTNVLTVIAQDFSGNQTTLSRTYFWIETNTLAISVSPPTAGKFTGVKNGQLLIVGNAYSVTAVSTNKSYIFSQWTDLSGDVLSSSPTFDYFDTNNSSPATLIAHFVQNPFTNPALTGTYTGLYFDADDETVVRDDGYITITVTGTGAFTGKIYNADYSKTTGSLFGQLAVSPDGSVATATPPLVLFGRSDYLQVNLQIATDPATGMMTGSVNSFDSAAATNETDSAQVMGELSFYNTNTLAGVYNVVIAPASADPTQGPGGYSYGTATVSKKGAVTVILHLADGVASTISFSSALARDGTCPIYAALYGGNAAILGWMQFATDDSGSMTNATINWFTESYDPSLLPRDTAFSAQPLLSGGLYLAPKAGTNIFGEGQTDLTFEIDPGYNSDLSLSDEIDIPATFNAAKSTFSIPNNSNKLSITLTPSSGALSGTFANPAKPKTSLSYKGVVVDNVGYGFYTAPDKETGPIAILNPAAAADIEGFFLMGEFMDSGSVEAVDPAFRPPSGAP